MAKSGQKKKDIDLEPDAWARFERAVNVVAKSPPQHRVKSAKSAPKKKTTARKANRRLPVRSKS
jgi:hypothetical protein